MCWQELLQSVCEQEGAEGRGQVYTQGDTRGIASVAALRDTGLGTRGITSMAPLTRSLILCSAS